MMLDSQKYQPLSFLLVF